SLRRRCARSCVPRTARCSVTGSRCSRCGTRSTPRPRSASMPEPQPVVGEQAASAPPGEQTALAAVGEQPALAAVFRIGPADIPLWPEGQRIEPLSAPLMASTHFADHSLYHAELT